MPKIRRAGIALVAVALLAALAGCSSDDEQLVIYSGRNQNLVGPLLERFAAETGLDVHVKYADTGEILATLMEEGEDTRADVFLSQDAGALGVYADEGGLIELPEDILEEVDPRFRGDDGHWVGVTGRARVIAYNTENVDESELPDSVLDVTDPKWEGRVGFPPTNASFIAFVGALRQEIGDERTREFLEGLRENGAKRYDNNILVLDAVARGEIDLGLVNHYYLYNELKESGDAPVANYYPGQGPGEEGTLVNVAGVGVVEGTDQREAALRFVRFLLSEEGQEYFRTETAEYPLAAGVEPIDDLPPLDSLRTVDVPLDTIGRDLEGTVEMIKDVGLS